MATALRPDFLSALAAFESAARHQNFAHAAEELHLTASAASHHVRKLEARRDLPLFHRRARGVSLTPEGRRLVCSDPTDALEAAAHGVGAALAREKIVAPWLAAGTPVRLPGPVVPTRWNYFIVYPAHRKLRPLAQACVSWLLEDIRRKGT